MTRILYGKGGIEFDEARYGANVIESRIGELKAEGDGRSIVRKAIENPIESPRLRELAKGKKSCVIIISDHTRPVPSKDILPEMFAELEAGAPGIEITLLVATGFHRLTTAAELEAKLGADLLKRVKVVLHDSRNAAANVQVGCLPSGAPCVIDRVAADAELLISEGFIEPHFFAGFSGGRKSVLPGVADQVTVLGNHCSKFIDSPFARTGILDGNPLHEDMMAAAKMAKLAFIVNVVIDESKQTVAAFAGDPLAAHRQGCDFLLGYAKVSPRPADIVITSNGGFPLDQNLYQCVKGMTAAEATCNPGGVIIDCVECADGHGGQSFYESLKNCTSADDFYAQCLATPQDQTIPDQWEAQILARIIRKFTVIVVSRLEMRPIVEAMKMRYAASLDAALAMARRLGKRSLTVIPNGISVVVARQSRPKGPGLGILTAVVLTLAGQVLAQPAVDAGQARKIRVACIGDSITWGAGMTNRVAECYPRQLQRLLGDRYDVRNFGDSGSGVYSHPLRDSSGWIPHPWRAGRAAEAAYAFKPDVVVSNLGINDYFSFMGEFTYGTNGLPQVKRGLFRREYVELLKAFARDGRLPRIILWRRLSPLGKRHRGKGQPGPFVMADELERVAAELGAETLDMYAPLVPYAETADFTADGVHPEAGAQRVIAEVTARQILRLPEE